MNDDKLKWWRSRSGTLLVMILFATIVTRVPRGESPIPETEPFWLHAAARLWTIGYVTIALYVSFLVLRAAYWSLVALLTGKE